MKENRGISLIELIVVVGIIGIIASVVLVNVTSLGLQARVNAAANQILDVMKEARHDSVTIKEFKSNLFPSYGVYFDISTPRKIVVYADCVADDNKDNFLDNKDIFLFNPSATDCNGGNGFVKEINLDSNVRISEIRSISFGFTKTEPKLYLEFVRPEPTVWITLLDDTLLPAGKIEMDITDIQNKFKKTIIFWSSGQFAIK